MKTKTPKASSTRKPLCTLEPNTRDKENVGCGKAAGLKETILKSTTEKQPAKGNANDGIEVQITRSVSVQTTFESQVDVNDLISADPPSENYWKLLAQQRLKALEKTLKENEELHAKVETLEKQKQAYRDMLDETNTLVSVLQDMLGQENGSSSDSENSD